MVRRVIALSLIAAVLGSTFGVLAVVAPEPPAAHADVAMTRPVYGRNSAVVIAAAQTYYTPSCASGVGDWIYPISDIYVIKGSALPTGTLSDASGAPNTVFGYGGGGVFDEVIGYTKPAGSLGPGTYSIVIDECQDKTFNPAEDTFVRDAFRVTSDVVGPQIPDIGAIKARAQTEATRMSHAKFAWEKLLKLADKGPGSAGKAYKHIKSFGFGIGGSAVPNPSAIATMYLGAKAKAWEGIAADPPDPAFDQPTLLRPTAVPQVLHPDDPYQAIAAPAVADLATSAALAEALLHSIERYQGAQQARDGEWQLEHARAMRANASRLADQLVDEAPALDALADAVATLDAAALEAEAAQAVADLDAYLAAGPDAAERAWLANEGLTAGDVAAELRQVRDLLDGLDVGALVDDLRASAAAAGATAADLDAFAASVEPVISQLAGDPFVEGAVPDVDAGGPYDGAVGSPLALAGSAVAGVDLTEGTYAWDIDGDGAFDDAEGASPTVVPDTAFSGLAGLRVTSPDGTSGVGYAPIEIGDGPPGPSILSSSPADRLDLTVAAGTTQVFSIDVTGDSPTVTWYVAGHEVATGTTFTYAPAAADAGTHLVEAMVEDGSDIGRAVHWYVRVTTPDVDGDGYQAHVDCDDTEATTYPGAPELLDGIDNDCDPTSPDGGVAPVVAAGTALAGPEGATITLSRSFTHPSGAYTATVNWGDGSTTPATVSGKTVTGSHVYADDGVFQVEVCVKAAAGKVGCSTNTATISNVAAGPRFSTLHNWTEEELHPGHGVWTVAPDGLSVFQSVNGEPTFFMSDIDVPAGIEAGVNITVETTSDDDLIGFALGLGPGFMTDPNADYLLVDWKQYDQNYGGCNGDFMAEEGLAVSRVRGAPTTGALWSHQTCAVDGSSSVTELARATNLGSTGWADHRTYAFRFRLTPERLLIWVDGELEFDLVGTFPMGRLGFYNYSQQSVRYSGYQLVPGDVVEGTPRTYTVDYDDPGTADTHTGRISWGDGSPDDTLIIDGSDGRGTGSKAHNFLDDGSYDGEVCITDDDGATACQQFPILVSNAPPVMSAGRDRTSSAQLALDDSSFRDPGVLDEHTVTVDWGDGSPVEDVVDHETMGEGIVEGSHTYAEDGEYVVEICVTDDDGARGCDSFTVTVVEDNAAPVVETDDDASVVEGSPIGRGLAFTDPNPGDTHTATIDWGDGTAVETVALQANGRTGSGGLDHVYADDGEHTVTVTVCDDRELCDTATSTVTVANADPTLELEAELSTTTSYGVTVVGTVGDVGVPDTHTATIDWGDGTVEGAVVVEPAGTGGGNLEGAHTYAGPGLATVEVCVTDDDGGSTCAEIQVDPAGLPPGPPTDVSAVGGDGNARVRWKAPIFTGDTALLQYEVETRVGGSPTPGTVVTVTAPTLNTIVGSLSNNTEYEFRVRVSNAYGWGPWSEPSNLARPRPSCPGAPFTDVGADHPFCPEIKWMGDTGVSRGYSDGSYRPATPILRQAMAAFGYRLLNPGGTLPRCSTKPFVDVNVTDTFCPEITWMKDAGITSGFADGTFRPTAPVARQAMAAFLYRLDGSPDGTRPRCVVDEFTDVPKAHPFCGEVRWLVSTGVTEGYANGSYGSTAAVARQAMAAFIFRYNIHAGLID